MFSHFRASAFFTCLQLWRPQHRLWFKLLKLHCRTLRADWGGQEPSSGWSALSRLPRFPGLCSCCLSPEVFPGRLQERPTSLECPSRPAHSVDCWIVFQEWGLDTPNQFAKSQFPKWSIRWMTNLPWVEGSFFLHYSFPETLRRSSVGGLLYEWRSTFHISHFKVKCAPLPGCLMIPLLCLWGEALSKCAFHLLCFVTDLTPCWYLDVSNDCGFLMGWRHGPNWWQGSRLCMGSTKAMKMVHIE